MLIDGVEDILSIDTTGVTWVLVIEKEVDSNLDGLTKILTYSQSTFRTLASCKFHQTCKVGPGIIVTVNPSRRAPTHLKC